MTQCQGAVEEGRGEQGEREDPGGAGRLSKEGAPAGTGDAWEPALWKSRFQAEEQRVHRPSWECLGERIGPRVREQEEGRLCGRQAGLLAGY